MQNSVDIEQENRRLRKAIADKDHRINILEEYILSLKQKQFGSSSEKLSPTQTGLFDEADDTEATVEADSNNPVESIDIPAHSRSAKRRVSIPADIPRVDIVHDLPGDQKVCPHDGTALKCIGSETHKQLDIILATVQVLNHIRYKYACPCCEKYLITATKPAQAIEKSIASAGLLAYIATQKYVDGLPLYRQVEIFKCIGIEMDRGTLASWMVKSGQLVQPLINLIHEKILAQHFLHMDETQVQVLNEPNKTAQSKSYMWVLRSTQPTESAVLFRYEPSRSGAAATDLLDDFTGTLMVDSYEGYNAACSKNSINRLGCWAHARRKFIEAQKVQVKGKIGRADWAVAHIQKLYRLEAKLAGKTAEEKYTLRQQHTVPLLKEFKVWLDKSLPQVPPKTALGKALYYLNAQWPRLINYIQSGDYPIDNNAAENAIRPFVIGWKNLMPFVKFLSKSSPESTIIPSPDRHSVSYSSCSN